MLDHVDVEAKREHTAQNEVEIMSNGARQKRESGLDRVPRDHGGKHRDVEIFGYACSTRDRHAVSGNADKELIGKQHRRIKAEMTVCKQNEHRNERHKYPLQYVGQKRYAPDARIAQNDLEAFPVLFEITSKGCLAFLSVFQYPQLAQDLNAERADHAAGRGKHHARNTSQHKAKIEGGTEEKEKTDGKIRAENGIGCYTEADRAE